MYKRLRIYYLYTALPFLFLLLGAAIFHKAIIRTLVTNPHPQVNYMIFAVTLVGGILILINIGKLMNEARELARFIGAKREAKPVEELLEMALSCDADIAYVLRMMAVSTDKSISHQEQIAIETELHKAADRINSRNAIPQFLGGLLVGLGLLGTFIGLLATLDDIAVLISSFGSIDLKTASPITVFAEMVQRMEAPMHSMGIAFSASMYGLMGSIVLGFMMVAVRRCISEIMSNLGSEVAQHIEFTLAREGFVYSRNGQKNEVTRRLVYSNPSRNGVSDGVTQGVGRGDDANNTVNQYVTNQNEEKRASFEYDLNISDSNLTDEIRLLKRIEERIAESSRIQERSIIAEIEDFNKQRAETLRILAENVEATNNFRSELQRIGRQLGDITRLSGKSQTDIAEQVRELRLSGVDSATETHRLLLAMIEQQRELLQQVTQLK